jgi:hypothetical protein
MSKLAGWIERRFAVRERGSTMKLLSGRGREAHWLVHALAALFAWWYLSGAAGH